MALKTDARYKAAVQAACKTVGNITADFSAISIEINRKGWATYLKITSWTAEKSPLIAICSNKLSVKRTSDAQWVEVHREDYQALDNTSDVKKMVSNFIESEWSYILHHM